MRSEALQREDAELRAEIHEAFRDVNRADGVSWSESRVIDDYGDMGERLEARRGDKDRHWSELVDDRNWREDQGFGGFSFLDAIGFRYYLPAAMLRCMSAGYDTGIEYHLTMYGDQFDSWKGQKQALLDDRQRRCVARFIQFMIAVSLEEEWGELNAESWQHTLKRYWFQFLPGDK